MINCDLNCVEPTSSDLVPRPLKKRMVNVLTTQPILQNRRLNLIMPKKQSWYCNKKNAFQESCLMEWHKLA